MWHFTKHIIPHEAVTVVIFIVIIADVIIVVIVGMLQALLYGTQAHAMLASTGCNLSTTAMLQVVLHNIKVHAQRLQVQAAFGA